MLTDEEAYAARDTWYALAESHLLVAKEQHQAGRHDFTIFHAYHAYECLLCAFIASHRWEVPPHGGTRIDGTDYYQGPLSLPVGKGEHDARAKFAAKLLTSDKPYYDVYARLDSRRRWRNESLYVEGGQLPSVRFSRKDAEWCLKNVEKLMSGVWNDIQNKPARPASPQSPDTPAGSS